MVIEDIKPTIQWYKVEIYFSLVNNGRYNIIPTPYQTKNKIKKSKNRKFSKNNCFFGCSYYANHFLFVQLNNG